MGFAEGGPVTPRLMLARSWERCLRPRARLEARPASHPLLRARREVAGDSEAQVLILNRRQSEARRRAAQGGGAPGAASPVDSGVALGRARGVHHVPQVVRAVPIRAAFP